MDSNYEAEIADDATYYAQFTDPSFSPGWAKTPRLYNECMPTVPEPDEYVDYPLTFEDQCGVVDTICRSDGRELVFSLRGCTFRGQCFDFLDVDGSDLAGLSANQFSFDQYGDVQGCFTITVPVGIVGGTESSAVVVMSFDYRNGGNLVGGMLTVDGAAYQVAGKDDAESCLIGLQRQLPPGVFLRCCLSCRWSHYTPGGNGDFGDLGCFVDWPGAADIASKIDTFHAWDDARRHDQVVRMQETWSCPRFRLLNLGEWAYKDWDWGVYGRTNG